MKENEIMSDKGRKIGYILYFMKICALIFELFAFHNFRKGASRYLTVYKREGSSIVQADAVFQLVRSYRQHVYTLLHKFPLTNKERQELLPLTERDRMLNPEGK